MIFHRTLSAGRWQRLSLTEQMAHIGSEVERALRWQEKNDNSSSKQALARALELLELTISAAKPSNRKELTRVREVLLDFFYNDNTYHFDSGYLRNYFNQFAVSVRR